MYAAGIHLPNNSERNKFNFTLVMCLVIRSAILLFVGTYVDYSSCIFFSDKMVLDVNVFGMVVNNGVLHSQDPKILGCPHE